MNIYSKNITRTLFCLLLSTHFFFSANSLDIFVDAECLDVMVDCAYPISAVQAMRQNLVNALYASQHANYISAITFLHEGQDALSHRKLIQQDDREFIQAIIDQINALIGQLEGASEEHRSVILDVCQQIENNL